MDGNGRWANNKGQDRVFGHLNGVESVREAVRTARKLGIKYQRSMLLVLKIGADLWRK